MLAATNPWMSKRVSAAMAALLLCSVLAVLLGSRLQNEKIYKRKPVVENVKVDFYQTADQSTALVVSGEIYNSTEQTLQKVDVHLLYEGNLLEQSNAENTDENRAENRANNRIENRAENDATGRDKNNEKNVEKNAEKNGEKTVGIVVGGAAEAVLRGEAPLLATLLHAQKPSDVVYPTQADDEKPWAPGSRRKFIAVLWDIPAENLDAVAVRVDGQE